MLPISVCIITKNEEKHMEEFLQKLRPYDWEIVVVDTGSTDSTRSIALKYADIVGDFEWINDFSAARNYSISLATREYIMIMDCDEIIYPFEPEALILAMNSNRNRVGCLTRRNHYEENHTDTVSVDYTERLFPKAEYFYEFPIHEQLTRKDRKSYLSYHLPITAEHYGYQLSPEEAKAKVKRNNDLLLQELAKKPDNTYILFQIGQSYNMIGEYEEAYAYYHRAMLSEGLNIEYEYVQQMIVSYGYAMLYTNRIQQALDTINVVYEAFDELADFHCMAGNAYQRDKQYLKAMSEFIKATGCTQSFVEGANSDIPYYNMGYINELLGDKDAALVHYRRCESFPLANTRIKELTIS